MNEPARKAKWVVWGGLAVGGAILIPAFVLMQMRLRDQRERPLPVYGPIADFALTNQNGQAVSLADLRGHVWVADIIFTRCAGTCPQMSRHMQALQQALPRDSQARLVSLTTDPDFDTPPVLRRYAERFGADPRRWIFLTGTKQQIAKLAVASLKLSALPTKPEERASPEDLFVHSTIFVVVDTAGRIRGVYETAGEGVDPERVKPAILEAVRRLARES